ncbi:hypothetical protein K1719_039749 [Acacia pycnantha]|nr:hypothetical protein K1719_039749 [Acacia pycnantha]
MKLFKRNSFEMTNYVFLKSIEYQRLIWSNNMGLPLLFHRAMERNLWRIRATHMFSPNGGSDQRQDEQKAYRGLVFISPVTTVK